MVDSGVELFWRKFSEPRMQGEMKNPEADFYFCVRKQQSLRKEQ
jgi:hypothetical protein